MVHDAVAVHGLDDAERNRDRQGQHERGADDHDVVRQLMQHERVHALVEPVRVTEVAVGEAAEEREVLLDERAVEAVDAVEDRDLGGAGARAEDRPGQAAGNELLEQKVTAVTPSTTTTA